MATKQEVLEWIEAVEKCFSALSSNDPCVNKHLLLLSNMAHDCLRPGLPDAVQQATALAFANKVVASWQNYPDEPWPALCSVAEDDARSASSSKGYYFLGRSLPAPAGGCSTLMPTSTFFRTFFDPTAPNGGYKANAPKRHHCLPSTTLEGILTNGAKRRFPAKAPFGWVAPTAAIEKLRDRMRSDRTRLPAVMRGSLGLAHMSDETCLVEIRLAEHAVIEAGLTRPTFINGGDRASNYVYRSNVDQHGWGLTVPVIETSDSTKLILACPEAVHRQLVEDAPGGGPFGRRLSVKEVGLARALNGFWPDYPALAAEAPLPWNAGLKSVLAQYLS